MIRLFRVPVPLGVLVVLAIDVVLLYLGYIGATYAVFDAATAPAYLWLETGLAHISAVIAAFLLAMYYQDMYSQLSTNTTVLVQRLASSAGAALMAEGLVSYVNVELRLPLRIMVSGTAASCVLLCTWRTLYRYLARVIGVESVLFVGSNHTILQIGRHIREKGDCGLRAIGYMGEPCDAEDGSIGKYLGPLERVGQTARRLRPDRIVIGMTERRTRLPVADLVDLRFEGFLIEEASSLYESVCGRIPITVLLPSALIFSGSLGPRPRRVFWHNALNFGLGVATAVLLAPLMIVIALAVKLTSPGPVLYRQKRVGLNGALFNVLKFRTMYEPLPDADPKLWDTDGDPRVTPFGRVLRKARLNEVPQIFNVLKGEMAIVGPRPERPEYVAVFSEKVPFYGQRHRVLPGITGWAQINYGHADSLEDTMMKLEYDLYYIKYLSIGMDVFILWQTIKTVLLRRGAG